MGRLESVITTVVGVILYYGNLAQCRDICDVYGGTYTYCDKGYHCCNDNTQCCADGLSAGSIIGIIFGIIFLVGICVFCTVFITKKKKLRPNQLVRPHNQQNVAISTVAQPTHSYPAAGTNTQGQNYPYSQTYYPYGQQIPYGHQALAPIQPPPYSQDNSSAAYPPPEYKLEP